jgi:hypothetical protein
MEPPPLLPQDLEPELYAEWRRFVQEVCLLYERPAGAHFCWKQPREVRKRKNPFTQRILYGCMRCLRSHMCSEPEHSTCPRVVSEINPGSFCCPFSAREIDGSVAVANSSFDQREATRAAMRDNRSAESLEHSQGSGIRAGHKMAHRLKAGASRSLETSTRNSMNAQALQAIERAKARSVTHSYTKFAKNYQKAPGAKQTERPTKRRKVSFSAAGESDATGDAADENHDDGGADDGDLDSGNNGDLSNDPLALWTPPHVTVPTEELAADDVYLRTMLNPAAAFMATEAFGRAFATRTVAPAGPAQKEVSPVLPPMHLVAPGTAKDGVNKQIWLPLRTVMESKLLVPHQRNLNAYVANFLQHYEPLLGAKAARAVLPATVERYAVMCDRLLWFYHRYVAPHATDLACWRLDYVLGEGLLWPDYARYKRILFAILTRVLTREGYARDRVTDAKVFVWLPDPFLLACDRADLFHEFHAPEALLPQKSKSAPSLTRLQETLMSLLKCTTFSAHRLYDYLHGA